MDRFRIRVEGLGCGVRNLGCRVSSLGFEEITCKDRTGH